MSKKEKYARCSFLLLCQGLTIATIALVLYRGQYSRLPLAVATVFLLLIPPLAEKALRLRISLPVYLLALFYAVGPMLGQCHGLYYTLSWWDKLLHCLGGVMFALVGLFLFRRFLKADTKKVVMAAVFALCFSMTVSVLWEFCEFGSDLLLGTDMQQDRLITGFSSYLLGDESGVTGAVSGITEVLVNGQALPGYIDVGLRDTMTDMLWEALGAAAVAAAHLISKGRYFPFRSLQ